MRIRFLLLAVLCFFVTMSFLPRSEAYGATIWPATTVPDVADSGPDSAVELGVKFRADSRGTVTGIRFYKAGANTGTHTGSLWTLAGTRLATATFRNETASGWQQVNFTTPVAINANTVYVASYHTNSGHYSCDQNFFTGSGVDAPPLHAPADGVSGYNCVYAYGTTSRFPSQGWRGSNYWVDVVFNATASSDTIAPTVNTFTIPATATSLTVSITGFSASDNVGVTGYMVTETAAKPLAAASGWTAGAPASYTFASDGSKLLYAWARDAAGNVSAGKSAAVTITLPVIPPPASGTPILVVKSSANPFSTYYDEILEAEGLNSFDLLDITSVTATVLAAYDVAILGEMTLTAAQVTTLTNWVNAGGHLIAMRPDGKLAGLLGLVDLASTMSDAYLLVNTGSPPGAGIVNQTVQYHGEADLYALNGATSLATLYSDADTATASPAATLRSVGANGGQAAAFTYDLARSVVYTRQGNPAWSGQERDGFVPIRSDDLYYGAAAFDRSSDWVDLDKVAIPQADEQQRLLANLIIHMNQDKKPLPRFWYFPRSLPAVVVMTGDDHGSGGTAGRFDSYLAAGPPGCSVDNWECLRGTSYIYTSTPLSNAQALSYSNAGFEVGLHVLTNCADWSAASLESFYSTQLSVWRAKYGSLPAPSTNRTHCIVWSDYVTQSKVEQAHGIRLDANYYYWPPSWVNDNPGFFTGSGMPMRFADSGGRAIDVYQATTQMTDESGQSYPFTIDTLLDRAIGSQGYYGAFVVNAHTDQASSSVSDAVVGSARARGVPVVSSRQLLRWLDGRNGSTFSSLAWNGSDLTFSVAAAQGATGLVAMVPILNDQTVTGVTNNGNAVPFSVDTVKGIDYARFAATGGAYRVSFGDYTPPPPPPDPSTGPFTIWPASAVPGIIDTGPDNAVELGVKFRSDVSGTVSGVRFYKAGTNSGTHTGSLWTGSGTRLATATFTDETASGWQQADFATPVAISANTVYVVSYHTSSGHYSDNLNYFTGKGVDSPPLHALADGVSGVNGVFAYGAASNFPSQGWNSSNYWVDVVFNANTTSALTKTLAAPQLLPAPEALPVSEPPTLSAITLTPGNQRIAIGTTQQFTATGVYSDGSRQNLTSQAAWNTSNINVIAVSGSGVVTAYSPGTATISATLNGITGSTDVTATEGVASLSSDQLLKGGDYE